MGFSGSSRLAYLPRNNSGLKRHGHVGDPAAVRSEWLLGLADLTGLSCKTGPLSLRRDRRGRRPAQLQSLLLERVATREGTVGRG